MVSLFQNYKHGPIVSLEQAIQALIDIVPDIEQMYDKVKEHMNESDEYGSIRLYRLKWKTPESSFQFILNETLRNSQNHEQLHNWSPYIRLFLTALSKLSPLASHTIYRGVQLDLADEYSKGEIFTWLTFTSCKSSMESVNNLFNEDESRVIFIIDSYSAKDISSYSLDDVDDELILCPERQFEVISTSNYGKQVKFIQVKEIQQSDSSAFTNIPHITLNNFQANHQLESIIDRSELNSKIDLIKHKLTDDHMNIIVNHAIIKKQCENLLLSSNKITSNGAEILAGTLDNNSTLKCLRLSYNPLSDQGVKSLTEMLSFNNCVLNTLSLHKVGLTDEGMQYICKMLKTNTNLTWLHLGGNKISDQGISLLTNVLIHENNTLKVLDLSHNKSITDVSVNCLMDMIQRNKSLETLWINDCEISFARKKTLQKMKQTNRRFLLILV